MISSWIDDLLIILRSPCMAWIHQLPKSKRYENKTEKVIYKHRLGKAHGLTNL